MALSLFPLYLAALTAVYLAPGPDMALVMSVSGSRGVRSGAVTAVGIALARFLHVIASGLGLATLLMQYPSLQGVVKGVGAAYLLYLAWKAVTSRKSGGESSSPKDAGADLLTGFLTNLLNPKALLFCSLFLPQFVIPGNGPLPGQFLTLGLILVAYGLCFDLVYALLASGFVSYIAGSRMARKVGEIRRWLMASVFTGIAVRLFAG